MRMQDMDAYFESKGFKVERRYHSCDTDCNKGYYQFIITKNNNHLFGKYMWPDDQQKFMDRMIRDFEKAFPNSETEINCISDLIDYAKIRHCDVSISHDFDGSTKVEIEHGQNSITKVFWGGQPGHLHTVKHMIDIITGNELEIKLTEEMWPKMNPYLETLRIPSGRTKIKNVIFNDPATIVLWTDGTKTVVKAQEGEIFDPEKGLAMAISKKALGNKGNYCNELKKWLPKKYLCMYCGAETTNPDWGHMCDECKNEPLTPIPETLKKKICCNIKIPDLSSLKEAATNLDGLCKKLKDNQKEKAVKRAYDILTNAMEKGEPYDINLVVNYLGEALED